MEIKITATSEIFENLIELSEALSKHGNRYSVMSKEGLGIPVTLFNKAKIQNSTEACQEALTHLDHLIPEIEMYLTKYKTLRFEYTHLLEMWKAAGRLWEWTVKHHPEKACVSLAMFEKDRQEKIWEEHCRDRMKGE